MYSSVVVYLARIRVGCPGFLSSFLFIIFPFLCFLSLSCEERGDLFWEGD